MVQWQKYSYYEVFGKRFSAPECDQIIELHTKSSQDLSRLYDFEGNKLRDSHVTWIRRTEGTAWIFERIESAVREYNNTYNFEIGYELNTAQLTRYGESQQYGWHVDLGAKRASLRKISAVVALTPAASSVGGGLEIFYGDALNNKVALDAGDIVVFPSFVMHRASKVESGIRWSLVVWFEGAAPFR